MKLIGILCWYDESASWLAASIASLAKAGVDHLVAVDGAYRLYPDGRARSPGNQQDIILKAAYGTGIGVTLHAPQEPWPGNEVEKRAYAFAAAELVAEPGRDWYFVLDADEVVTKPGNLRAELERTELNVAEVSAFEYNDPLTAPGMAAAARRIPWPRRCTFPVRKLFRALPGLTVVGNHYTYVAPDREHQLYGNRAAGAVLEEALDLTQALEVEHRTNLRDMARRQAQLEYYKLRAEVGAEDADCARCHRPATKQAPTDFELHPEGMVAGWIMICDECEPDVVAENEAAIRAAGLDPAELSVDLSRPVGV
jgi:hypothetical protein